jgi:molybdopterin adenylyltransferase
VRCCRWQVVYRVIPDERSLIEETLKELCDKEGCCLVVTTGGTGPAPRDVTPEATEAVRQAGAAVLVLKAYLPTWGDVSGSEALLFLPSVVVPLSACLLLWLPSGGHLTRK